MNPFFQTVIIAYLFFVVPVLLGALEAAISRREEKSVAEIITNGYLIMLALFWGIAVLFIQKEQALSALTKVWCSIAVVGSLSGLIVGRRVLKNMLAECKQFWQGRKYLLVFAAALSIVVSIVLTRPSSEDITVLIVDTAIETDSMYLVNPYSGYETGIVDKNHANAPIEMLYATAVQLTGGEAQMIVYYILPIVLISFFFLVIWRIACTLFEQEEQQIGFEMVVIILYWMTTYMKNRTLVTGIFLNSWNGLTMLSCIILPLAFSVMMKWLQQAEQGIKQIPAKVEKCVLIAILFFAAQLTNSKGGFYIVLMLFLSVAVMIVKGGYAYGIKTGRFKKCI